MANTTRTLAGVLGVVMLTASPAWAQSALRIAVHIEDHAGLDRDGLYTAQKLVSEVYEAIGIDLVWVDRQGATESGRSESRSVRVLLLSPAMAARKIRLEGIKPGVLGQASPAADRAYVFADQVKIFADQYSRDFSSTLGLVVAHEVGHLLLPANSHSDQGIMRDNIVRQQPGARFTESQARIIHGRLTR